MFSWPQLGVAPLGVGSSAQLKILFVINDLYMRGNGLVESARRTIMLLRERGHDVRVLSALQVAVMIVASVCLIIRFRTFVSRSLRHSLPLRATPLPVRIVARSTGRSTGRTWGIWKSLSCCRPLLRGVRALVVCQLWRPITFIRKT